MEQPTISNLAQRGNWASAKENSYFMQKRRSVFFLRRWNVVVDLSVISSSIICSGVALLIFCKNGLGIQCHTRS
jgi:hypothetical protein